MKAFSRKNIWKIILISIISSMALTGCGDKKESDPEQTTSPSVSSESAIPTPGAWATSEEWDEYYKKMAESITLEPENGKYEYDQDDNIIDDSYRNFYEIFVSSFCDSNGDGVGDLNGITSKLDYIQELGFNGIWLTPIHMSSSYHKYNVIDYYSIDNNFGTMEDFDKLVSECDKRGIKLIMDLVMNHTSTDNAWFKSATASIKDGSYASNKFFKYYNFSKTKEDKFYPVSGTPWYYEGWFVSEMPDTNLMDNNIRAEYEKIVDFWMDKGVGGFRLDGALHYEENDTDKNVEILKWFNDYVKSKDSKAYIVAEVWTGMNIAWPYLESGIDSVFNFEAGGGDGAIAEAYRVADTATTFEDKLTYYEKEVSKYSTGIDAPFSSNHDIPRLSGGMLSEDSAMKSALAMLQIMKGSTFVYYGDEIGMAGSGAGDANYRAGMYWSNTNASEIPKAPSACSVKNTDHVFGSVEEQEKNNTSILNYTKRLLELKNENPEIARGTTAKIESITSNDVIAVSKTYNGSTVYILLNTGNYATQVNLSKSECNYSAIRGYASGDGNKVVLDGETITLPAASIVVLK